MTDIEKKALALVNEAAVDFRIPPWDSIDRRSFLEDVLCRAIEQHEAFRQEVSDAVERVFDECEEHIPFAPKQKLRSFILAKPDPLVDALLETFPRANGAEGMAADLRAALAARGLEIREKQP